MTILDLLVLLAQGDARVTRVPIPRRLSAAAPAVRIRTLEARIGRALARSLVLSPRARTLEARAGGLCLKRYLVGLGDALTLSPGGVYLIDGAWAYVVDPRTGGLTLRDADFDEVRGFMDPTALVRVTP